MSFFVKIWGKRACFTRPEFKVERVSYDVITPSAARGILSSIYWHPGIDWVIDRIQVCKPIVTRSIVRNEVKKKIHINGRNGEEVKVDNSTTDQRHTVYLKDVEYIIEAHFEINGNAAENQHTEEEFASIIGWRMRKGRCFKTLYLGCHEFGAFYEQVDGFIECPEEFKGEKKELGWMLLGMDYSNPNDIQPRFFRAEIDNSIIHVPRLKDGMG